ncbi:PadR family transcriptional regulator [Paremcibacter congregatus]|uniref:PadR family transcriptional regulator n=1 Tax=Paremcibacter congregatus TaxID=2043170 RepID=A0A2G4YLW8_9PROT|nr:PadR family transcriptional regulator [Paremcibacter congregatus]PHZ83313.1 hypothetical protein CRD36_17255 [Paremcibacter congregatus]QDE28213.1 PadR family transcriptional regulator [Paremcibacter congregatus]
MTNRRKSRTKFAILGFLASKPRSGYDLKKAIEKSIGFFWSESYGQIYPILSQLVKEGHAIKLPIDETSGRKRQQYAITDAGIEELKDWIEKAAEPQTYRNELLLKIFFGHQADPDASRKHLEEFKTQQKELNETFKGFQSTLPDMKDQPLNHYVYLQATINYGILMTEASLKWANDTLRMINRAKS